MINADDLNWLLDLVEKDPVTNIRHQTVRLLIKTPPFERGRHHRNDTHRLVERLWGMINGGFWYDSRLRCDIVDLYYTLYGRRRPPSLPLPELAAPRPRALEEGAQGVHHPQGGEEGAAGGGRRVG